MEDVSRLARSLVHITFHSQSSLGAGDLDEATRILEQLLSWSSQQPASEEAIAQRRNADAIAIASGMPPSGRISFAEQSELIAKLLPPGRADNRMLVIEPSLGVFEDAEMFGDVTGAARHRAADAVAAVGSDAAAGAGEGGEAERPGALTKAGVLLGYLKRLADQTLRASVAVRKIGPLPLAFTTSALLTELSHVHELLASILLQYGDGSGVNVGAGDDYQSCMATLVSAIAERSDAVIGTTIVSRNPFVAGSHWLQLADRHTDKIRKLAGARLVAGAAGIGRKRAKKRDAADKGPGGAGGAGAGAGGELTYEQYDNSGFVPAGLFANSIVPTAKFLDLKQEGFSNETVVLKKAMRKVLNGGGSGGLFGPSTGHAGHAGGGDAAPATSGGARS